MTSSTPPSAATPRRVPFSGIIGDFATGALDSRILPDADDCWIIAEPSLFGRIAVAESLDAAGTFQQIRADGAGDYVGPDVPGFGDEAFCTGVGATAGSGILVRAGNRLVFVSTGGRRAVRGFRVHRRQRDVLAVRVRARPAGRGLRSSGRRLGASRGPQWLALSPPCWSLVYASRSMPIVTSP